jgi:hypothetical protein
VDPEDIWKISVNLFLQGWNRGQVHQLLGNKQDWFADLSKALELEPDIEYALRDVHRLLGNKQPYEINIPK